MPDPNKTDPNAELAKKKQRNEEERRIEEERARRADPSSGVLPGDKASWERDQERNTQSSQPKAPASKQQTQGGDQEGDND